MKNDANSKNDIVASDKNAVTKKTTKAKKPEPILRTTIEYGKGQHKKKYEITGITEKAYRKYKAVHKRKAVRDFHVYINLDDKKAYFVVNGEEGYADETYQIKLDL
ncbi:MAG: DUF6465 family protein [Oscillospiraceae bacterium]|nr:DUF6465 family protein [Oscillospiraceae bacterium]